MAKKPIQNNSQEGNIVLALLGLCAVVAIIGVVLLIMSNSSVTGKYVVQPIAKSRLASIGRAPGDAERQSLCVQNGETCFTDAVRPNTPDTKCCWGSCTKTSDGWRCL